MLPQKKGDPFFLSVPVSRVPSIQRLAQLSSQGNNPETGAPGTPNPYASIPSTPGVYVSSSLNPTRNTSANLDLTNNGGQCMEFENLSLVQDIRKFESKLTTLSSDIASFKEDRIDQIIAELIKLNDSIYQGLERAKKNQELGTKVKHLESERKELELSAKNTLKELIGFRAELKQLPSLPTQRVKKDEKKRVDIKEVLKYAMKLSKFTKVPPSSIDLAFQTHPNNYIWPAEDALRRGMLALSSLNEEQVIAQELPTTSPSENEETNEVLPTESKTDSVEKANNEMTDDQKPEIARIEKSTDIQSNKTNEQPQMIDLDLFDPDEDEFSD